MVMERKHMKKRLGLGIATALAAMSFGQQALAQAVPPPWSLNGSDTWFDVITQALIQANTDCPGTDVTNTISNLHYAGGGSGTGETNLLNNKQSIAPMSRNFKGAIIGTGGTHTNWNPTLRNVGGLDAAVVDTKGGANRIKNIQLPTPVGVTNEAAPNDSTVPCDFGTQGSCYTQLMGIVMGGTDGSGSVAACSSPARVQAILDLAALQHVSTIEHFYRRDDNSGTTDTIKEKLKIANFCNGRARGVLGSNTVDPTNNNLNNQDNDPIRRACPAASASFKANKCTDFTTGLICTSGATCTQGLVVAMSDPDPGQTDVTVSIGIRVGASSAGTSMGYSGREGKNQTGAAAPYLNTNGYSDTLVRLDTYMLSRRLFLQYAPDNTDLGSGGGGANELSTELKFFNYATDSVGNNCSGVPGRCSLNPILRTFGFIPCLDDCTATIPPSNLCNKQPYPVAAATVNPCIPNSTTGAVWDYTAATNASGAAANCCSDNSVVANGAVCPAVSGLPTNSACARNADCSSGTCSDIGIGIKLCS